MKTTFSHFQGMFENSAPAKYYFIKQNQKYYEIRTIIRMCRKIIDDHCL